MRTTHPVDHIIAEKYGGRASLENLALSNALTGLGSRQKLTVEVLRGDERETFVGNLGSNIDPRAKRNEGPVHEVALDAFFLSKYEMTQAQWLRWTGENPSGYQGPESRRYLDDRYPLLHPVNQISWNRCSKEMKKLGLLLPTEAQWEYAARAGSTTVWWTGNNRESLRDGDGGKANFCDLSGKEAGFNWYYFDDWPDFRDGSPVHARVGTYPANAFGLHEVHGNVWEPCRDIYTNLDFRRGNFEVRRPRKKSPVNVQLEDSAGAAPPRLGLTRKSQLSPC